MIKFIKRNVKRVVKKAVRKVFRQVKRGVILGVKNSVRLAVLSKIKVNPAMLGGAVVMSLLKKLR